MMHPEAMLKGRMAETLVEELLKKSGNQVYRFGYEAILQNLTQIERTFEAVGDTADRIKALPDFIVIDKNGDSSFVEVKYRRDGRLNPKDHRRLNNIKKFWNAKIVFVNLLKKSHFMISEPPYYDNEGGFRCRPIIDYKEWNIDLKTYEEYEQLVEKYLQPKLLGSTK